VRTVFGPLLDSLGLGTRQEVTETRSGPVMRQAAWAMPASEVRSVQPGPILVNLGHYPNDVAGEIVHLERAKSGTLWAVGQLADWVTFPDWLGPLYWSAETLAMRDASGTHREIEIEAVGIVRRPAQTCLAPLTLLEGALDHRQAPKRWQLDRYPRELLTRAASTVYERRRGDPLVIRDERPAVLGTLPDRPLAGGRLEYRSATTVDVWNSGREIELVVMPYESEAAVPYEGRMIAEVCDRHAFDGHERETRQIRVNRDHARERTVGRVTWLDPHNPLGLLARLKISRTPLGDETLALAADDCLDASAGFRPLKEHWEGRNRRRLLRCWLDHVALTPDPAYKSARVLAVRSLLDDVGGSSHVRSSESAGEVFAGLGSTPSAVSPAFGR